MVKYKEYLKRMLEENKPLFDSFRQVHDKYVLEPEKYQEEFNRTGQKVVDVVREYENKLCGRMERGTYSKYSANLAEKFQAELRKLFPKIELVGVIISDPFTDSLKRIRLS